MEDIQDLRVIPYLQERVADGGCRYLPEWLFKLGAPGMAAFAAALRSPNAGTCAVRDAAFYREVRGGWLVARDRGEFGGGLWFASERGAVQQLMSSRMNEEMNLDNFADTPAGLLVLGGVDHMGFTQGQVLRASEKPGAGWVVEMLAELPAAPIAWTRAPDGDLLVLTDPGGAFAIDVFGLPRALTAEMQVVCGACEPRDGSPSAPGR